MELFTTTILKPSAPVVYHSHDVHNEERVSAYCELCWRYDVSENMILCHEVEKPWSGHTLAHAACLDEDWEVCNCH